MESKWNTEVRPDWEKSNNYYVRIWIKGMKDWRDEEGLSLQYKNEKGQKEIY